MQNLSILRATEMVITAATTINLFLASQFNSMRDQEPSTSQQGKQTFQENGKRIDLKYLVYLILNPSLSILTKSC